MDYSLAFKKFFGIDSNLVREKIIISNIRPVFTGLIDRAHSIGDEFHGFYDVIEITLKNGENFHLIKIASGNNIIDAMKLLRLYVKEIIFIGIAGCLDSQYSLGEVFSPNCFINSNFIGDCENLTIYQTSGLIQNDDFYYALKKKGVTFVDMESYDIYCLCQEMKVKLKYIVQISDFPIDAPFYSVGYAPINIAEIEQLIGER